MDILERIDGILEESVDDNVSISQVVSAMSTKAIIDELLNRNILFHNEEATRAQLENRPRIELEDMLIDSMTFDLDEDVVKREKSNPGYKVGDIVVLKKDHFWRTRGDTFGWKKGHQGRISEIKEEGIMVRMEGSDSLLLFNPEDFYVKGEDVVKEKSTDMIDFSDRSRWEMGAKGRGAAKFNRDPARGSVTALDAKGNFIGAWSDKERKGTVTI